MTDYVLDGLYRLEGEINGTFYKCLHPIAKELRDVKYLYVFADQSRVGSPTLVMDKVEWKYSQAVNVDLNRFTMDGRPPTQMMQVNPVTSQRVEEERVVES
ncbi:hypothetical protein GOP47_0030230 [Adiantum capillus-veneris]|nr:hypothetical protein GOP47_0030230 [Adiantum capillus-veneris]